MDRNLDWEGCFNVRDLGGLLTADGRTTRHGAVVRADSLDRLTQRGWQALTDHGVRTVIDLRNDEERDGDASDRPSGLTTLHVPLDDTVDTELWEYIWSNELNGTPLYYPMFVRRKAERCAAAVAAVARARPGGVVIHCGIGRDRTGLITLLLLDLAGVVPGEIAADYELSAGRLPPLFAALDLDDQGPFIQDVFARKHTSARAAVLAALESIDAEYCLRAGGLDTDDLAAIRARLVAPD